MSEPHIDWIDGQPYSRAYGDVYFSRDSGMQETQHVFLQGNDLPQRWAALDTRDTFVIGETGFGTGLNFLCAWQCWNRHSVKGHLHFISFELQPLSIGQLRQAHAPWPELAPLSAALCDQYDAPAQGWHRYAFQDGAVTLTLIVGDARSCLPRMSGKAQAWFLDGFAPARNPQLWDAELLQALAQHSHPGATFATYTSAGAVRRALQAAGFIVHKRPGHGRKREMTQGWLEGSAPTRDTHARDAIVVGAGMAGCASARALAARGWRVRVLDPSHHVAGGASGLPQAVLHLRLPRQLLDSHRLAMQGYQHSLRLWRSLRGKQTEPWAPCGTLQLDHVSRRVLDESALHHMGIPPSLACRVSAAQASEIAGMDLPSGGLHFPLGGWMDGRALCEALLDRPGIEPRVPARVVALGRDEARGDWQLKCADGTMLVAPTVVLANAASARTLLPAGTLPLHEVRGQITLAGATPSSSTLRTVLCGEGVVTPAARGSHSIGATYRHSWQDDAPSDAEHQENCDMLRALCPALHAALQLDIKSPVGSFVGYRVTTPDRTPIAGAWPGPHTEGLYLNLAHGSRGFSTAPLLAEYIASLLEGEPSPLPAELESAVDVDRFAS